VKGGIEAAGRKGFVRLGLFFDEDRIFSGKDAVKGESVKSKARDCQG